MNKRVVSLALALILALALVPAAGAETEMWSMEASSVSLNKLTGVISLKSKDLGRYALVNTQGEVITTAPYTYLYPESTYGFFKAEVDAPDGIHKKGLIDSTGRVLVPTEYYDVDVLNSHWQIGTKLIPATSEDNDVSYTNYSNNTKTFYRYDTHDVYYDGVKVGTLTRADLDQYATYAYNEYFGVRDRMGKYHFYNKNMEESPLQVTSSGEYAYEYANRKYTYYHVGTGQIAFDPSCTLTADEVSNPYHENDGLYYDLQGNLVFTPKVHYASISRFDGRYALIRLNNLYGVIDSEGNQVLPMEYDSVGDYEDHLFQYGYAAVVKGGKLGFVDKAGRVTADFKYSSNAASIYGCFARIKDLDGTYIVISGAVGELPEHYADVSFPGYYGCMAFEAENAEGQWGLVGLNGETLIPFEKGYRDIEATLDGRVAVAYAGSSRYDVYLLDEQVLPEAPATKITQDGSWVCSNGHAGNTGKFCSECGEPKPVSNVCPNCGHDFGAEQLPKFCSECGTKLHD